jgi:hypothetical protein
MRRREFRNQGEREAAGAKQRRHDCSAYPLLGEMNEKIKAEAAAKTHAAKVAGLKPSTHAAGVMGRN